MHYGPLYTLLAGVCPWGHRGSDIDTVTQYNIYLLGHGKVREVQLPVTWHPHTAVIHLHSGELSHYGPWWAAQEMFRQYWARQ